MMGIFILIWIVLAVYASCTLSWRMFLVWMTFSVCVFLAVYG